MKRCLNCNATFDHDSWSCVSCKFTPATKDGYLCFAPNLNNISAFDESSFVNLRDSLDKNFWYPPRNDLIVWAFKKYFPDTKNFLEVGCGNGYNIHGIRGFFKDASITGVDFSKEMIENAKRIWAKNQESDLGIARSK